MMAMKWHCALYFPGSYLLVEEFLNVFPSEEPIESSLIGRRRSQQGRQLRVLCTRCIQ